MSADCGHWPWRYMVLHINTYSTTYLQIGIRSHLIFSQWGYLGTNILLILGLMNQRVVEASNITPLSLWQIELRSLKRPVDQGTPTDFHNWTSMNLQQRNHTHMTPIILQGVAAEQLSCFWWQAYFDSKTLFQASFDKRKFFHCWKEIAFYW